MSLIATSGCEICILVEGKKNINSHPTYGICDKIQESVSYRLFIFDLRSCVSDSELNWCLIAQLCTGGAVSHLNMVLHRGLVFCEIIKGPSLKENQVLGIKLNVPVNSHSVSSRNMHTHTQMLLELTIQCFFKNTQNTLSAKYDGYYINKKIWYPSKIKSLYRNVKFSTFFFHSAQGPKGTIRSSRFISCMSQAINFP